MPKSGRYINCEICGKEFYRKRSEIGGHIFCSQICYQSKRKTKAESYPKLRGIHTHRIIAELLAGPLPAGAIVHHKDGDKRNFDPSNLEILKNQSEHARRHFTGIKQNKEHIAKRSASAKMTRAKSNYVTPAPTQDLVFDILSKGPLSVRQLAMNAQKARTNVSAALYILVKKKKVIRLKHGVYARNSE